VALLQDELEQKCNVLTPCKQHNGVEVTLPALNFFIEVPEGVHVLKETFSSGVERDDLTAWVMEKSNFGAERVEHRKIILGGSNSEHIVIGDDQSFR
jgi:hypothetical protein